MGRATLYILLLLSAITGVACAVWLVVVVLFLWRGGGTYSQTFEDGSIACGIQVFPEGKWFWPAYSLLGAPAMLLAACVRTIAYCSRRLSVAGKGIESLHRMMKGQVERLNSKTHGATRFLVTSPRAVGFGARVGPLPQRKSITAFAAAG